MPWDNPNSGMRPEGRENSGESNPTELRERSTSGRERSFVFLQPTPRVREALNPRGFSEIYRGQDSGPPSPAELRDGSGSQPEDLVNEQLPCGIGPRSVLCDLSLSL
jgi:hypothetical protein